MLDSRRAWHARSCGWPCYASYTAPSAPWPRDRVRAPLAAQASLARPSLQQTTPSDADLIQSFKKFVPA